MIRRIFFCLRRSVNIFISMILKLKRYCMRNVRFEVRDCMRKLHFKVCDCMRIVRFYLRYCMRNTRFAVLSGEGVGTELCS